MDEEWDTGATCRDGADSRGGPDEAADANGNDSLFSRCSAGKGRWYWCVWASFKALCDGDAPAAHGMATSAQEAEQAALALAPGADQLAANYAAGSRRRENAKKLADKPAKGGQETAPRDFVYHDWCSDYDGTCHSTPHLVVKKTAKKVFVEKDAFHPGRTMHGDWRDYYYRQTWALDQAELAREGSAPYGRRGWWQTFYSEPWERRKAASQPRGCHEVLGLAAGATVAEVKSAYRRLARRHHPDCGGDAGTFLEVRRAYEEALAAACQDNPGR